MEIPERIEQYRVAVNHYNRVVTKLQRLRASGAPRHEYHAYWRDVVDPAGQTVRLARAALRECDNPQETRATQMSARSVPGPGC
jgi:hypothetical protein